MYSLPLTLDGNHVTVVFIDYITQWFVVFDVLHLNAEFSTHNKQQAGIKVFAQKKGGKSYDSSNLC